VIAVRDPSGCIAHGGKIVDAVIKAVVGNTDGCTIRLILGMNRRR
jgi:hypothetical protein